MSHRTLKGVRHGARTTYRKGCRCTRCCEVERTYQREKGRKRRAADPSTRYVQHWTPRKLRYPIRPLAVLAELYAYEEVDTFTPAEWSRWEQVTRERRAKRHPQAAIMAAAKAQLEREMSHALSVGRGGRPRKSSHIPCLSEAA